MYIYYIYIYILYIYYIYIYNIYIYIYIYREIERDILQLFSFSENNPIIIIRVIASTILDSSRPGLTSVIENYMLNNTMKCM